MTVRVGGLFDGSRVHSGPRDLAIGDGRIVSITASGGRPVDRDLSGCFALPGLIDAHTHLSADRDGTTPEARYRGDADGQAAAARRNAAELLGTGVTTVADCGGPDEVIFALRDDIAAGAAAGPAVHASGHPVCVPHGHDAEIGDPVGEGEDPARVIHRRVTAGADFIKVMLTPGGGETGAHAYFTAQELRRMVQTAHAAGVRLTVHAHDPEGIERAVTAGVDGIEHCTFLRDGKVLDAPGVLDALAAGDVPVCPTNAIDYRKLATGREGAPRAALVEGWRRLVAAGVPIVGGSDVGVPMMRFDDYALVPELMVHELGMSTVEALAACTSRAARYVRAPDAGRLAPGCTADVLIVDGDPAADISDLRRVHAIVKDGMWVPDELLLPTPDLRPVVTDREGAAK